LNQGRARLGGAIDLDALEAYLTEHAPLTPPTTDRITRLP
jgi:5'-nucleotidase